jgi:hypothetical protein
MSDEISTAIDATTLADDLAVFASARLVDTETPVGAIAFDPGDRGRGLADRRTVSGWSFFAGDETDEELEDPERIRMPSMAWVVGRDPSVTEVTDAHDGTRAFWVREDAGWRHIDP